METLTGTIERITYYNEDSGYTVARITPDQGRLDARARDGTVSVVGVMPELNTGEAAEFGGQWVNDPRYGLQFKAETVKPILPTSAEGIKNYLSSGIVKGIGPRTAEKIVDYFGEETLDVLSRTLLDAGRMRMGQKTFEYAEAGTGAGGGGGGGGGGGRPTTPAPGTTRTITVDELEFVGGNLNLVLGAAGIRFNPWRTFLVSANLLFPFTKAGLRDRVTPSIGIDYLF